MFHVVTEMASVTSAQSPLAWTQRILLLGKLGSESSSMFWRKRRVWVNIQESLCSIKINKQTQNLNGKGHSREPLVHDDRDSERRKDLNRIR